MVVPFARMLLFLEVLVWKEKPFTSAQEEEEEGAGGLAVDSREASHLCLLSASCLGWRAPAREVNCPVVTLVVKIQEVCAVKTLEVHELSCNFLYMAPLPPFEFPHCRWLKPIRKKQNKKREKNCLSLASLGSSRKVPSESALLWTVFPATKGLCFQLKNKATQRLKLT